MTAALHVPEGGASSEDELTRLACDVLPGGVLGKFRFAVEDGFYSRQCRRRVYDQHRG